MRKGFVCESSTGNDFFLQISSNGVVTFNGALPDDHEPRQLPFTSPTGSGDAMIAVFWANHGANHEFPSNKVFYDIADSNWMHDVFVHFCDNCSTDAETQWVLRVTRGKMSSRHLRWAFSARAPQTTLLILRPVTLSSVAIHHWKIA